MFVSFRHSGRGDLHDVEYGKYRHEITLTGDGFFGVTSTTYTLTIYPTSEFFDSYSTKNPLTATIGAVVIVCAVSLLFFLYDYFVRDEFNQKQAILEAKRAFMRFVSHEVRTPLVRRKVVSADAHLLSLFSFSIYSPRPRRIPFVWDYG